MTHELEDDEEPQQLRNSYGRGGRASAAARQHYLTAVAVLAEVMNSQTATDEARVHAASKLIDVARAK